MAWGLVRPQYPGESSEVFSGSTKHHIMHIVVWQNLSLSSMEKTSKLFTMHRSLVVKRVCTLRTGKREEILRSVRGFFS